MPWRGLEKIIMPDISNRLDEQEQWTGLVLKKWNIQQDVF